MGPRSDNRGYGLPTDVHQHLYASMGPRSDNRGYADMTAARSSIAVLQWVHGPITVVIGLGIRQALSNVTAQLQWVHGPITVVMKADYDRRMRASSASMGPRSDNRGYGRLTAIRIVDASQASMGPRSDNRGYGRITGMNCETDYASMGPRSDNRGYGDALRLQGAAALGFNGSTVR